MKYEEYLKLKEERDKLTKQIKKYESNTQISNNHINKRVKDFLLKKYDKLIDELKINAVISPHRKMFVTTNLTVENKERTHKFTYNLKDDIELIINDIIKVLDEELTLIQLYNFINEMFESISYQRQCTKLVCKKHIKYPSLNVTINIPERILELQRIYKINKDVTLPVTTQTKLDEVRICGNVAIGIKEELEAEINRIKTLKITMQ